MSLRRNRKQKTIKKATKVWAKARASRPAAIVAGVIGLTGVVAAARKRRAKQADLPYGPPNESVPSHETLAQSKEEAAKAKDEAAKAA